MQSRTHAHLLPLAQLTVRSRTVPASTWHVQVSGSTKVSSLPHDCQQACRQASSAGLKMQGGRLHDYYLLPPSSAIHLQSLQEETVHEPAGSTQISRQAAQAHHTCTACVFRNLRLTREPSGKRMATRHLPGSESAGSGGSRSLAAAMTCRPCMRAMWGDAYSVIAWAMSHAHMSRKAQQTASNRSHMVHGYAQAACMHVKVSSCFSAHLLWLGLGCSCCCLCFLAPDLRPDCLLIDAVLLIVTLIATPAAAPLALACTGPCMMSAPNKCVICIHLRMQ